MRYRADESNNLLASDTVEVTVEAYVAPEKPAAPTGLTAAAPETADGAGAIEGTDAEMEYAAKGNYTSAEDVPADEWIPCFGETTAVMPGTYYVRVKADPSKNRLTGDAAAITVPELGQTIPEAPEGLRGKAPETADGMGSLIGTTAEMAFLLLLLTANHWEKPGNGWTRACQHKKLREYLLKGYLTSVSYSFQISLCMTALIHQQRSRSTTSHHCNT